jgi:hypothetical protein
MWGSMSAANQLVQLRNKEVAELKAKVDLLSENLRKRPPEIEQINPLGLTISERIDRLAKSENLEYKKYLPRRPENSLL